MLSSLVSWNSPTEFICVNKRPRRGLCQVFGWVGFSRAKGHLRSGRDGIGREWEGNDIQTRVDGFNKGLCVYRIDK